MRLSEYLREMYDAIDDEEVCIEEAVKIENYMYDITEDAYEQGSITKNEYDTITKILFKKRDLLMGVYGLLDKLRDILKSIEKGKFRG
jgi:hypothetical protein